MKKSIKILAFVFVFLMLMAPVVSGAVLVPCGVTDKDVLVENPEYGRDCDFKGLMNLVNIVIKFILYDLAVPIAAIMFVYAGFLMIVPGGESASKRTKAKNIFTNAVIGLLFVAAAFLIVRTLLSILGYQGSWIGFYPI